MKIKKPNIQKNILKILAEKPAVSIDVIKNKDTKTNYAIARSVKNLVDSGCAEIHNSENQKFLKIMMLFLIWLTIYQIIF